MLLLNTPYFSNMILCLFDACSTKVRNMPLRALFHSPVLPSIFRSPLETYVLLVRSSTFMHPWILSKFLSFSYLSSMSYLFRVCLHPKSHPSCKRMMRRSHAWAMSCRTFLHLFLFISTEAIGIQQSNHQVTYKSLTDELFCLAGSLQGAGEAAVDKKLLWCSRRSQLPLHASSPQDRQARGSPCTKLGISTSPLSPAGFLCAWCLISRCLEQ